MGYNLKATKKSFDPLPVDRYTLKVESTTVEPHKKGDTEGERIEIVYRVVGGEFEDRKVWDYIYLPGAAWKARTILEAGDSPLADSEDITADDIANALVGLEVSAYIETSKGEGDSIRTNVKEYKSVMGDIPALEKHSSLLK